MTYRGHVENGVIVLDEPGVLPEGTRVVVEACAEEGTGDAGEEGMTLYELYEDLIGSVKMPADWAQNHDKYLREEHERR